MGPMGIEKKLTSEFGEDELAQSMAAHHCGIFELTPPMRTLTTAPQTGKALRQEAISQQGPAEGGKLGLQHGSSLKLQSTQDLLVEQGTGH